MKELKKDALKIFSKSNLKTIIIVLIIKFFAYTLFLFLLCATIYAGFSEHFSTIFPALLFATISSKQVFNILLAGILVFTALMLTPLKMGFYLWISKTKKDSQANLLTVFHYYNSFHLIFRSIMFEFLTFNRTVFVFLLYFAPTAGTFIFAYSKIYKEPETEQLFLRILILASAVLIFNSAILFFKYLAMQISAKFLFVMHPNKNIFSILRSASFLLHVNSKDFTKLLLSLWGVFFTGLFIMPLPFAFAYTQSCICEFTRKIVYKQNQGLATIPLNQTVIDINVQLG